MAKTCLTDVWMARECACIWSQADPFSRVPRPLRVVFGDTGREVTVEVKTRPASAPATLYIFDFQWTPQSDIYEVRDRLLRPLVRHALEERGEWRSAFRKLLLNAWRADPWPHRDVLGAA